MTTAEAAAGVESLLGFLVRQCRVDAMGAMKIIPTLIEGGVKSEGDLLQLGDAGLKELIKDAKTRKKVAGALRRLRAGQAGPPEKGRKRKVGQLAATQPTAPQEEPEPPRTQLPNDELGKLDVVVNRSPVMILWAACVARTRGFDWSSSLSLAQAVADWYAQKKGEYWGIRDSQPEGAASGLPANVEKLHLVGVTVFAVARKLQDHKSYRALDAKREEIPPSKPARYVARNFGDHLAVVHDAMRQLAATMPPDELSEGPTAYSCYEKFRPDVAKGAMGWGGRSRLKTDQLVVLRETYASLAVFGDDDLEAEGVKTELKEELKTEVRLKQEVDIQEDET